MLLVQLDKILCEEQRAKNETHPQNNHNHTTIVDSHEESSTD